MNASKSLQSTTPFAAPPIPLQSAEEAFVSVLKNAGAILPKRDPVDARAISDTQKGSGHIISSEKEVGGWPVYASGAPALGSGHDCIADDWKRAHGLSLSTPVANQITSDGYTELESYLNSLVPDDLMK